VQAVYVVVETDLSLLATRRIVCDKLKRSRPEISDLDVIYTNVNRKPNATASEVTTEGGIEMRLLLLLLLFYEI